MEGEIKRICCFKHEKALDKLMELEMSFGELINYHMSFQGYMGSLSLPLDPSSFQELSSVL